MCPVCSKVEGYITDLEEASDEDKAKFGWQVWQLSIKDGGRFAVDLDRKGTLPALLELPTGLVTNLEIKRQVARALSGFTSSSTGALYAAKQETLVEVVQKFIKESDEFTKRSS